MEHSAPTDRPGLRPGSATVRVDGHLVVGHEDAGRVASFDGVTAVLVESLDGSTSVADLADDLADALDLPGEHAERTVRLLVESLRMDGLLDGVAVSGIAPRRLRAEIPADSCLGARMGLSRAEIRSVPGPDGFRFGATVPHVVGPLGDALGVPVGDHGDASAELILARLTVGKVPRLQQIFTTLGRRSFAGRSAPDAVDAFCRTVAGRHALMSGGVWLEGVSLMRNGRLVLVQPGLEEMVLGPLRPQLEQAGIRLTPSGLVEIVGGRAVLPANPLDGSDAVELLVAGALVPWEVDATEGLRQLLHLARRWDDAHFAAVADLLGSAPFVNVSDEPDEPAVIERLRALTDA